MSRTVVLFSGQWTDLSLDDLAARVAEWGYQGIDVACWGDHFEVQRALSDDEYCQNKLALFNRLELAIPVLSNHRLSQAICDVVDQRHRDLVPDYVWGDGQPEGVRQRAAEEMMATIRAAQKLGVGLVAGFTGSPIWSYVAGYPGPSETVVAEALEEFAKIWNPILDVCNECGLRYACEVHPGQLAYDYYSTERVLEAIDHRVEFGLLFDPSHLQWIGVDPVEFLRRFHDRIYHVHIKDVALTLNGRSSLLNSYLPKGDARRGWHTRSPGRGGVDWEAIIRALNEIGYDGSLAVEWADAGMNRDQGAEEACKFVKRLDFEPSKRPEASPFR